MMLSYPSELDDMRCRFESELDGDQYDHDMFAFFFLMVSKYLRDKGHPVPAQHMFDVAERICEAGVPESEKLVLDVPVKEVFDVTAALFEATSILIGREGVRELTSEMIEHCIAEFGEGCFDDAP